MKVRTGTNKPKGAAAGNGKKKGVRVVPLTLPSTKRKTISLIAEPLLDDEDIKKPIPRGKVTEGNNKPDPSLIGSKNIKGKAPAPSDLEAQLGVTIATPEELKNLSVEVGKAVNLTQTIEGLEEMLKAHRAELHNLTNRVIPDIMRAAHTSSFKMDNGAKVELKDFMNGSLPKEPELRQAALAWLDSNGARDLIKTHFELALGRGQKEDARKVRAALDKLGMTYKAEESVHAQSLYGFARERMKAGKELPIDLLGLYMGQVAKIELPDKSAG